MKKSDITRCEEGKRHGDVCAVYELVNRRYSVFSIATRLVRLATQAEFDVIAQQPHYWWNGMQARDVQKGRAVAVILLTVKHEGSSWTGEGFKWTEITDTVRRDREGGVHAPETMIVPLNQIKRCVNVEMSVGEFLNRHYAHLDEVRRDTLKLNEEAKVQRRRDEARLVEVVNRLNNLVEANESLPQHHTWSGETGARHLKVHIDLLDALVAHAEAALALHIKPEVAV